VNFFPQQVLGIGALSGDTWVQGIAVSGVFSVRERCSAQRHASELSGRSILNGRVRRVREKIGVNKFAVRVHWVAGCVLHDVVGGVLGVVV
jgi:hypothetical protein